MLMASLLKPRDLRGDAEQSVLHEMSSYKVVLCTFCNDTVPGGDKDILFESRILQFENVLHCGDMRQQCRIMRKLVCDAEMVPKMLDTSNPVPEPALVVVKELMKQRETLLTANETPLIQAVDGSFVSPLSKFLPSEAKHCHFKMLKPPKGTAPVVGHLCHQSLALDHAAHTCPQ